MAVNRPQEPFNDSQTWQQRVLNADAIYNQVKKALEESGHELPKTPRRPDVRLILENTSGKELKFLNPGDHSKEQPEIIPANGDKKAVMVMLKGDTLEAQQENAKRLVKKFDLMNKGLSQGFAFALGTPDTENEVDEAYGPAPFKDQADRLENLKWKNEDGSFIELASVSSHVCAYGARAAVLETVFRSEVVIFVQGTGTVAEAVENEGICIAVSADWQTGAISTRPIVPSVARDFYGAHFDTIPIVAINPVGDVQNINLRNGTTVKLTPPRAGPSRLQGLRHGL